MEVMDPLLTAIKSSMTNALSHFYAALASLIKKEIRLYKIRTADTPEFLQNFSGGLQTLLNLHCDMHDHLQKLEIEINTLEPLAKEVSLRHVSPWLYSFIWQLETKTGEYDDQRHILQKFIYCLRAIQSDNGSRLGRPFTGEQTDRSNLYHSGIQILRNMFNSHKLAETLGLLRLFDERISCVQSGSVTITPQWFFEQSVSGLPQLLLEEIYRLFPSLRELTTIHSGLVTIIQCEYRPQGLNGAAWSRQPIQWAPSPSPSHPQLSSVHHCLSASAGFSRLWGSVPSREQSVISNESKQVKKSWAIFSNSSERPVEALNHKQDAPNFAPPKKPGTIQSVGSLTPKAARAVKSLQGDWSF